MSKVLNVSVYSNPESEEFESVNMTRKKIMDYLTSSETLPSRFAVLKDTWKSINWWSKDDHHVFVARVSGDVTDDHHDLINALLRGHDMHIDISTPRKYQRKTSFKEAVVRTLQHMASSDDYETRRNCAEAILSLMSEFTNMDKLSLDLPVEVPNREIEIIDDETDDTVDSVDYDTSDPVAEAQAA